MREAQDVGKEKTNDAEPCHAQIRPIAEESPQTAKGGRGLATESGDPPKAEAANVPYKRKSIPQ